MPVLLLDCPVFHHWRNPATAAAVKFLWIQHLAMDRQLPRVYAIRIHADADRGDWITPKVGETQPRREMRRR